MPRQKAQKREMKSCRLYLENNLSEAKVERLCQFMNRPNITCKNAGKKNQRYTGKEDSKSKFVPICYHIWTIIDLLEIINGCFGIVQSETDDEFRQDVEFLPTI